MSATPVFVCTFQDNETVRHVVLAQGASPISAAASSSRAPPT